MSEGRAPAGFYKGRAIACSEQYSVTNNDNDQIALDLAIPSIGFAGTTFLVFSEKGAPYAIERLRACGWTGDDLTKLVGIDNNEIDISIKYETWDGKERMKLEIATGGGRVKLENVMDEKQKRIFAARMKPMLSGSANTAERQRGSASAPARTPAINRTEGAFDPGPPNTTQVNRAEDDIPF
jgi:hypothetical protein